MGVFNIRGDGGRFNIRARGSKVRGVLIRGRNYPFAQGFQCIEFAGIGDQGRTCRDHTGWVAVKELKLSYHNMGVYTYIYIYIHTCYAPH